MSASRACSTRSSATTATKPKKKQPSPRASSRQPQPGPTPAEYASLTQSTFASTFGHGFRATNATSFRDTARLTSGFNAAANDKSQYVSVGLMKDSEYAELQKEAIELSLLNVAQEQQLTNHYQETLAFMLQAVSQDLALLRKRSLELQKEERVLGKQADQCEALDHSAHFMNISITSKFQIVKHKTTQNQKELEKVVDDAEEALEKERGRVARMKAELAEAIQQSDSLRLLKDQLARDLEKLDGENKNLQRIVDYKSAEYRRELLQMIDIDVRAAHQAMVAHFLAAKSGSKKPAKLTQREFEAKYAGGFDQLVGLLQAYVSQGQQDLRNREHAQKLQIEALIAKRKQLKKLQTDLRDIQAIDREALERAARHKADRSAVASTQQDSEDTEQPEEPDPPGSREERPASSAFGRMQHLIRGHSHIEEKVVGLLRRAQKFVVCTADGVSRLQAQHAGRGLFGLHGFRELLDVAQEADQLVTADRSRVNLGDFLLHDPTTLYHQFGRDSIIVPAAHPERVGAVGRRQAAARSHHRERPRHEPLPLAGRVPLQSGDLQAERHRRRRLPLLHESPRAQKPPRSPRRSAAQRRAAVRAHGAEPRGCGLPAPTASQVRPQRRAASASRSRRLLPLPRPRPGTQASGRQVRPLGRHAAQRQTGDSSARPRPAERALVRAPAQAPPQPERRLAALRTRYSCLTQPNSLTQPPKTATPTTS